MISTAEAYQKFLDIVAGKNYWKDYLRSQFIRHLSLFMAWALRDAQWKVERATQELFPSTALNRGSILAHAESRGYTPVKPQPATGAVTITNGGDYPVTIPLYQAFVSDSQNDYYATEAVTIAAGASETVDISQSKIETIDFDVTVEEIFHEIKIEKELSAKVADYVVKVDQGAGFETWDYAPRFHNSLPDDYVYDEFYSVMDEIGIRFGNGTFGFMPPAGATIRVTLKLTEGDIELPVNQALYHVGSLLDSEGQSASIQAVVSDAINGGTDQEDIESIRRNILYWSTYNENIVWKEDYVFALKRKFPQIRWINVWGETEQDAETGADSANINTIFVCLYAEAAEDIEDAAMDFLEGLKLMNRKFLWVAPVPSEFSLTITGSVARAQDPATVTSAITDVLEANYGIDSTTKLDAVRTKDIYKLIQDTGYFENNAFFDVTMTGTHVPAELAEMVSIDMTATTVTIERL